MATVILIGVFCWFTCAAVIGPLVGKGIKFGMREKE